MATFYFDNLAGKNKTEQKNYMKILLTFTQWPQILQKKSNSSKPVLPTSDQNQSVKFSYGTNYRLQLTFKLKVNMTAQCERLNIALVV